MGNTNSFNEPTTTPRSRVEVSPRSSPSLSAPPLDIDEEDSQPMPATPVLPSSFSKPKSRGSRSLGWVGTYEVQMEGKLNGKSWGIHSRPSVDMFGNSTKENQDAHRIKIFPNDWILSIVCDGHGPKGHIISRFVRDSFELKIEQVITQLINNTLTNIDVAETLTTICAEIQQQLETDLRDDSDLSGTTLVATIVTHTHIYCANIGDSRAVLGRTPREQFGGVETIPLSRDHKPNCEDEQERIVNSGGNVIERQGIFRVVKSDSNSKSGLAVSRSLGDCSVKSIGVIAVPEIIVQPLSDEYEYMVVLCSDGIAETIPSQELMDMVFSQRSKKRSTLQIANFLAEVSFQRWVTDEQASDDITAIVLAL